MELKTFVSAVFMLTLVMDPLGNIPLFISALKEVPAERKRAVLIRELLIALGIMVFFLLFGKYIVSFLAIDLTAMSVAGGIVLFLIALQMIFPTPHSHFGDSPEGEPFIVPLAIPLVAGPSTLTTVLLFSLQEPGKLGLWTGVVVTAWLVTTVNLGVNFGRLRKKLVKKGLLKGTKSLKVFRKTSNSVLKNSQYAHYAVHFLGQSPRGVNEINYTAIFQGSFADAVKWLGSYYGIE